MLIALRDLALQFLFLLMLGTASSRVSINKNLLLRCPGSQSIKLSSIDGMLLITRAKANQIKSPNRFIFHSASDGRRILIYGSQTTTAGVIPDS